MSESGFLVIEILDPVAQSVYVLDSANRVAHRVAVQAGAEGIPPPFCANNDFCKALGTQTISGVKLVGRKTTTTTPGTSVPTIAEIWTDPTNNVEVMRKSTGERGDSTFSIRNYSDAEPDPALFRIPADYRVVDEPTGTFTISIPGAH